MEKRGRWWMSERSNMYRDQDQQDDSAGASVLKAAAAMRLIGNAMFTLANTKADEAGSVNGTLDLLMDSFTASLAPILSLVCKVPEVQVDDLTIQRLWKSSAVHTPIFQ
uniref:Uncharacterized protein n=1 Tax=Ditylenchus dipsaci TaxID=166011 RepID=A0A915EIZ3_9BILA